MKRLLSRFLRWRDRERAWKEQRARFALTFREDLYLASKGHRDRRSHAPHY